jgi:hypothetical protein
MSKKAMTPTELIVKLGGEIEAARFFGVTRQAVHNWENRFGIGDRQRPPRFPPERYWEHKELLKKAGIRADRSIWFPHLKDEHVPEED